MDVFVTGGSGYVGNHVIPLLVARGHRVLALARSQAAAAQVSALGAQVVRGDVTESGAWCESAERTEAIVHLAMPSRGTGRRAWDWTPFSARWVRLVEAFETRALDQLIAAAGRNPRLRALITTTGPAASGHHPGCAFIDEDCLGSSSSFGAVQRMTERRTLAAAESGIPATVLRPGAVYGADGGFAARLLRDALRGRVAYAGRGDNYLSWVHIRDYARSYVAAVEAGGLGRVVAIVDDEPLTSRAAMQELAAACGGGRPRSAPSWLVRLTQGPVVHGWATGSARLRNDRAKQLLGFAPSFPNVRVGFAATVHEFRLAQTAVAHTEQSVRD